MHQSTIAFTTPADAPRWQRWLLYSPLARILIFVALFLLLGIVAGVAFHWVTLDKTTAPLQHALSRFGGGALLPLLAYVILVKAVEKRRIRELRPASIIPKGLLGIVLGLVLFSAVVGVMYLLGSYHVIGTNPDAKWLPALLVVGLGAGIGEEILFRGVLFRMIEEGLGTWWALAISALFFGAVHISNPGATLWSSVAIALEAGLLFGMLYHVTRSLPICMGLHAAWNFAQGTIYGIPVSGTDADGWLVSTRTGPDWLSGGIFGAEASVVALALCMVATVALIVVAVKRQSVVPFLPGRRRADRVT